MATKLTTYSLPEFVFLDGNSHQGDSLEGRTVIQHIRTYTIIEVIAVDEVGLLGLKDNTKTFEFEYINAFDTVERHVFALHFSLADDDEILSQVFEKAAQWYCDYLRWEDEIIASDNKEILN